MIKLIMERFERASPLFKIKEMGVCNKVGVTGMIVLKAIIFMLVLSACNHITSSQSLSQDIPVIRVDISSRAQFIRSFGASDAWACQYIGLWPEKKKQQVADWLFSKEVDEKGQPKGIGLSLWRHNIGAGSAERTDIRDPWRRAEGFLQSDGSYDWSKQQGQRWFIEQAKKHGVEHFLGFINSPPVQLTKNGKAFSSSSTEANIAQENYARFAGFLVRVLQHYQDRGIPMDYISPFNEPQWDWTDHKQEGTPYSNREIFLITRILDSLLSQHALSTKIQLAEAAKLNYLYEKADKNNRGNQIYEFFNKDSDLYVGGFKNVDPIISGHSYFTSHPSEILNKVRNRLADNLSKATIPLEFWQSEYCILGNQEAITPTGKDLGIDPALYVARIIHHDLTVANASSWSWWLAVSVYDYKDGLVYAEKNINDGEVSDSKTLWALGNFSRFIRPDAQRLSIQSTANLNDPDGNMVSSYINNNNELVVVAINYTHEDTFIKLEIEKGKVHNYTSFLTGAGEEDNLRPERINDPEKPIVIPGRSILTLVAPLSDL